MFEKERNIKRKFIFEREKGKKEIRFRVLTRIKNESVLFKFDRARDPVLLIIYLFFFYYFISILKNRKIDRSIEETLNSFLYLIILIIVEGIESSISIVKIYNKTDLLLFYVSRVHAKHTHTHTHTIQKEKKKKYKKAFRSHTQSFELTFEFLLP